MSVYITILDFSALHRVKFEKNESSSEYWLQKSQWAAGWIGESIYYAIAAGMFLILSRNLNLT